MNLDQANQANQVNQANQANTKSTMQKQLKYIIILLFIYNGQAVTYHDDPVDLENNIDNNCDFNIIRIKKQHVICSDKGIYNKYCHHYAIPEEITINKEIGLGNKEIYTIKPTTMFHEISNGRKSVLAKFSYDFTCNRKDNNPQLLMKIYPHKDNSPHDNFVEAIVSLIIIIILLIMIICICPNIMSDFWLGYIIGSNSNNRERIYCE